MGRQIETPFLKRKIHFISFLILNAVCGFSSRTFAQADVAVLMQKIQEMEIKISDMGKMHAQEMSMIREKILPIGTILPFAGGKVPDGFIPADGSVHNETEQGGLYKKLCQTLGNTFGAYCQLPNTQGVFLRGEGSQNVDGLNYSSGPFGKIQADRMQGHFHEFLPNGDKRGIYNNISHNMHPGGNGNGGIGPPPTVTGAISDGTNGTPRIGAETRPVNLTVRYMIKF